MKLEKDIENSKKVHGLSRETFMKVIKGRGFKVGVEIGVQYGQNAESILENTNIEKLYGIDPYDTSFYPISPLRGMDEEIYQHAMNRLKRFGDRYTHIRKSSMEGLLDIEGEIDFIYIDGGRSKLDTNQDLTYWYPKIKVGGIMAGNGWNHSSHPWVTRFLKKHYDNIIAKKKGIWWIKKGKKTKNTEKISVVTPFYNTSCYAKSLIELPLKDPRIDDIVIVDDFSEEKEYKKLLEIVNNNPKIRVYRNKENIGEFKTRIKAVRKIKNNWVIFLDGDNALTTEYLDAIYNIPVWKRNVIYCPDNGTNDKIDFRIYSSNYIGKSNINEYLYGQRYLFSLFLGTGNYFMNMHSYLRTATPIQSMGKRAYGDYYFNGEWLKKNLMYVVKGMRYVHRIRKNSAWMENKHLIQPLMRQVMEELRNE